MTINFPVVGTWHHSKEIKGFSFRCGYCGDRVGAHKGYVVDESPSGSEGGRSIGHPAILICPTCNCPNFFVGQGWGQQSPAPILGQQVNSLPADIELLYNEARSCTRIGAYTSCILACRKLLMHLAVAHGAPTNLKFVEYVDYLSKNGWTPPKSKARIDAIRQKGNEANHEIVIVTADEASEILALVEMLLRFMFEYADPPMAVTATSTS